MSTAPERKPKVLVIDDSTLALEATVLTLKAYELDAIGVTELNQIPPIIKHWRPDVILTDVNMPAISGADLCKWFKERIETKDVPIVLFSARPQAELDLLRGLSGADYAISKTEGLDVVAARIAEICDTLIL